MEALPGIFSGIIGLLIIIFIGALLVLWIILPFAVFGIKEKLDQMIRLLKENRDIMVRLLKATSPESVDTEEIAKISQDKKQWICPNCGTINLYYKGACTKCSHKKP